MGIATRDPWVVLIEAEVFLEGLQELEERIGLLEQLETEGLPEDLRLKLRDAAFSANRLTVRELQVSMGHNRYNRREIEEILRRG